MLHKCIEIDILSFIHLWSIGHRGSPKRRQTKAPIHLVAANNQNDMLLIEFFVSEYLFGRGLPNMLMAKRDLSITCQQQ